MLLAVIALMAMTDSVRAAEVEADLTTHSVAIRADFAGANVILFGSVVQAVHQNARRIGIHHSVLPVRSDGFCQLFVFAPRAIGFQIAVRRIRFAVVIDQCVRKRSQNWFSMLPVAWRGPTA